MSYMKNIKLETWHSNFSEQVWQVQNFIKLFFAKAKEAFDKISQN
jgi:hypothetical protein